MEQTEYVDTWNWPRREHSRPDYPAEYEAAERSQDRKDAIAFYLLVVPSVILMGLGISEAVQLVARWIA